MNEGSKTRPPEFGGNQLTSFEVARMASSFMIMVLDKDCFMK